MQKKTISRSIVGVVLSFWFFVSTGFAQQQDVKKDQYILNEEQKLQIIVHIWGEVNRPGQYLVPDGTSILELISLAGGPNEFSSLHKITLTREHSYSAQGETNTKEILKVNLNKHLKSRDVETVPILQPGDVIIISRNLWSRFQTLMRVLAQFAIIIQAIYFYSNIQ